MRYMLFYDNITMNYNQLPLLAVAYETVQGFDIRYWCDTGL